MKQLNPLMLLALVVSILFFLTVVVKQENRSQKLLIKEIRTNQKVAKEIIAYRKVWENRKFYTKNLERFVRNLKRRHITYSKKEDANYLVFIFPKTGKESSTYIFSSLLNQSFKIKSFQIMRLDNENLKIVAEVLKW